MKKFSMLLLCVAFLQGCIPIDDSLSPVAEEISIQEQYAYFDSLILNLTYTDNFGLDSAHISINKSFTSPEDRLIWRVDSAIDINGRRQSKRIPLAIPAYSQKGLYSLTVSAFDKAGNETPLAYNFEIIGDTSAPVFEELALNLTQVDGKYAARPNDEIEISGLVSDDLHISSLTFVLPQVFQTLRGSAKQIDIAELLSNVSSLRAPNSISTDALEEDFSISLVATDTFNNSVERNLDILLDLPPQLSIEEANLTMDENEVSVVENSPYTISNFKVIDNDSIISVRKTVRKSNGEEEVSEAVINEIDSINLADYISLEFTPTSAVGETEEITIEVADNIGGYEKGSIKSFNLYITSDALPKMNEEGIYINNELKGLYSNLSSPTIVSRGNEIEVIGKISDDIGIEYLEVYWQRMDVESQPIFTLETNANYIDLKEVLKDIYPITIPNAAKSGEIYVLTINARDINNGSDAERTISNSFYFEIL